MTTSYTNLFSEPRFDFADMGLVEVFLKTATLADPVLPLSRRTEHYTDEAVGLCGPRRSVVIKYS